MSENGYVPAHDAIDLDPAIRAGCCIKSKLLGIFGGDAKRPTLGARAMVSHAAPGFDEERILAYLEKMLEQYGGGLQRPWPPEGRQGEIYDTGMYGGAHFER